MIAHVTPEMLKRAHFIWLDQYKDQFNWPEFDSEFLLTFASVNTKGELISLAGVKPILEIVALTDKEKSSRDKYVSVYDILGAGLFTASTNHYDQLHAFVLDTHWADVMLARGFVKMKGQGLVIGV